MWEIWFQSKPESLRYVDIDLDKNMCASDGVFKVMNFRWNKTILYILFFQDLKPSNIAVKEDLELKVDHFFYFFLYLNFILKL